MKGVALHVCFDLQVSDKSYYWKKELLIKAIEDYCLKHTSCSATYTNDNFVMLTFELSCIPATSYDMQRELSNLVHKLGRLIAACRYQYDDINKFTAAYRGLYELFNLQRNDFPRAEYSRVLMNSLYWSLTGQSPYLDLPDDDVHNNHLQRQFCDYLQNVFSLDSCFAEVFAGYPDGIATSSTEMSCWAKNVKAMLSCTLTQVKNDYSNDLIVNPIGPIMVNKDDIPSVHLAQVRVCDCPDFSATRQALIHNVATMFVCNQVLRYIIAGDVSDIFNKTSIESAHVVAYRDNQLVMEICISQSYGIHGDDIVQEFADSVNKICNMSPNELDPEMVKNIINTMSDGIKDSGLSMLVHLIASIYWRLADNSFERIEAIAEAIDKVTVEDVCQILNRFSTVATGEHKAVRCIIPGALGSFVTNSPQNTIRPLQDAGVMRALLSHFKAS
ncbi:MAG: hypothetical protein Q4C83_03180, partial [Candidatus Saccharibacteria bacterium]|nr:hypothetical protein [Candidatus Saccharibacteria bacterium]